MSPLRVIFARRSEFLSTSNSMAIRRDSPGELKGSVHMATYSRVVDIERTATVDARRAADP